MGNLKSRRKNNIMVKEKKRRKTNNGLQNITQKLKTEETEFHLKSDVDVRASSG